MFPQQTDMNSSVQPGVCTNSAQILTKLWETMAPVKLKLLKSDKEIRKNVRLKSGSHVFPLLIENRNKIR